MRGTVVKANRRAIRRAMGPQVLAMLEKHGEQIDTLRGYSENLASAHSVTAKELTSAKGTLAEQIAELRQRKFFGRLKWLVTGN